MRYVRLYLYFLRFSFSKALQFRIDFGFRIVMDTAFYVVNLVFFEVLYEHTERLGGWSLDEVRVFIAGFFLVDALNMTVFNNNMWMLPQKINQGELDYDLVRPVSPLFFVATREFAANSFVNVLMAGGILGWALWVLPQPLGAGRIALYVVLLGVGTLIYWELYLLALIPTFWTHRADGLRRLFFGVENLAERPHRIFTGWARRGLLSVLPFALVASYPTVILLEGPSWGRLGWLLGVFVGLSLVVRWAWSRGLRAYSSASS